ncbi:cryptic curlin major subunit [Shigella flexneri]|nr:cryptic curlin major subunit [Shigella flexneri]
MPVHLSNNSGPNSELNIYQYGGGNSALALQTDARNSDLTITQHGGGNGADVGQGSDDSSIDLTQRGFGNSATLDQWNGKNSEMKWHTEFGHLNRGDMLTSEQHRCSNEKKKF